MPFKRLSMSRARIVGALFGGAIAGAWVLPASAQSSVAGGSPAGVPTSLQSGGVPRQGVAVPQSLANAVRQVDVIASASAVYDTNVTNSNSLRPPPPNLRKQDVSFPVALDVNFVLPQGPNLFSLSGRVGYEKYLHDHRYDAEDIGLRGGYARNFGACGLSLNAAFDRRRTQFGTTSFLQLTRNLQNQLGVGGTINCSNIGAARPFASINYSRARNSERTRQIADFQTVTYGGGLVLSEPAIGDIGLIGSIDDTSFPNRGMVGGQTSKLVAKSVGVYVSRATARILQAQVQVNYTWITDRTSGNAYSGISGNGLIRLAPGPRLVFTALVGRAAQPSLAYTANYAVETTWALQASAIVTPKISANASFSSFHKKYYGGLVNPLHPLTRDTRTQGNVSVSYALLPRIGLVFGVIYEQRRANDTFYEFSGVRASGGVTVRI